MTHEAFDPCTISTDQLRSFIERVECINLRIREKQTQIEWLLWREDRRRNPSGHKGKDGRRIPSPMTRFLELTSFDSDGCWVWDGNVFATGYGQFSSNRKTYLAHRWIMLFIHGSIPEGLVVDHLCRNRRCVNPSHLEIVTQSVNVRRGMTPAVTRARQAAKTHCPKGHPYSGANLYTSGSNYRMCRTCAAERKTYWAEKRKRERLEARLGAIL